MAEPLDVVQQTVISSCSVKRILQFHKQTMRIPDRDRRRTLLCVAVPKVFRSILCGFLLRCPGMNDSDDILDVRSQLDLLNSEATNRQFAAIRDGNDKVLDEVQSVKHELMQALQDRKLPASDVPFSSSAQVVAAFAAFPNVDSFAAVDEVCGFACKRTFALIGAPN